MRVELADDGGPLGKGGAVSPYYNGQHVGEGRFEATLLMEMAMLSRHRRT